MINLKKYKLCIRIFIIIAAAIAIAAWAYLFLKLDPLTVSADSKMPQNVPQKQIVSPFTGKQYKILHIMSYHSPWEWTDNQLLGFQTAIKDLNIQYHVMQMDAKRRSDEVWLKQISGEIRRSIDTSRPDMIYISDDAAAEYVAKFYVNSSIPIVFSAVNADPAKYGFADSENVTGILERVHYAQTLRLLQKLVPSVKRVAVITDTGTMWLTLIAEMKQQQNQFADIQIVSFDIIPTYSEFKQKVLDYQNKVDALGFFGVFEFKDESGKNVPMEEVLKWLQANSKLPDFSFWEDRVLKGTLCSVSVSAYEQGYLAGLYARGILLDGKSPAGFPMISTEKGTPLINMVTANRLGIKLSDDILRLSKVIQDIALK